MSNPFRMFKFNHTKEFPMPEAPCPHCKVVMDCATMDITGANERPPKSGDVTICSRCAHVLVFTEQMQLREIEREDLDALPLEQVAKISAAKFAMEVFHARQLAKTARNN